MRLYTTCRACRKEIFTRVFATDRPELAKRKGKHLEFKCPNCGILLKVHLNNLEARPSKIATTIAIGIFLFGPIAIFIFFKEFFVNVSFEAVLTKGTFILATPSIAYKIIQKQERDRVARFNNYKIKE